MLLNNNINIKLVKNIELDYEQESNLNNIPALKTTLENKVDKIDGKVLSSKSISEGNTVNLNDFVNIYPANYTAPYIWARGNNCVYPIDTDGIVKGNVSTRKE